MNHYAFREPREDLELQADFVVVGSGAGGATAARDLARGGASVIMVEAGAWRDPEHYPSSAYAGMRDMMPEFGAAVTLGRAAWPVVQGKGVGGTTVINSAICVRTPGDIFHRWAREHGIGGKAMAEKIWTYQDQIEEELSVEKTPVDSRGRSNTMAKEAAETMGFESHYCMRYVKKCAGTGQCLQGCTAERKQSLNVTYVPQMVEAGGVVVSCAPVDKVMLEGNRAIGVKGRFQHPRSGRKGARFTLRARQGVLMAASVLVSPVLLMASGVKNKNLGKGFRSHPGTGIFGWYDDPMDMNKGTTQGWASVAYRDEPGFKLETLAIPPELVASRLKGGGTVLAERLESYRNLAMWVLALRAESVGSIHRTPFGTVIRYTLDRNDMLKMRKAAGIVARMHFAAGARSVIPGVYGLPFKIGPDELDKLDNAPLEPRAWVGILSHLFGGCTMGADPRRSVCDERGRVHGYEGLVIADASQIPTNLGVNPQHTIMALARLRAHELLGQA